IKYLSIISIFFIIFTFGINCASAASGNAYIHYYNEGPGYYRYPTYSDALPHLQSMGYSVYGYNAAGAGSALSQLRNGKIFVVHNHGAPGIQYMGTNSSNSALVANPGSSSSGVPWYSVVGDLNLYTNLKIAILYGCKTGVVTSVVGDLPGAIVYKGATAAVAWTTDTPVDGVNEWNRLFFEKAKTDNIVESFRHADYWTEVILGTPVSNPLKYYRNEKGDIYAKIN
ncbi:MAG TPA: hypothetical protein IAC20_05670, partial [Candidatus Faecisoma merdavium]|nr:hypothetical protein [Candidatus Faecisoma merdavium]